MKLFIHALLQQETRRFRCFDLLYFIPKNEPEQCDQDRDQHAHHDHRCAFGQPLDQINGPVFRGLRGDAQNTEQSHEHGFIPRQIEFNKIAGNTGKEIATA